MLLIIFWSFLLTFEILGVWNEILWFKHKHGFTMNEDLIQ